MDSFYNNNNTVIIIIIIRADDDVICPEPPAKPTGGTRVWNREYIYSTQVE